MKKIIFMGSPSFAIPSLKKLINNNLFSIQSIYTKPPKAANRGHKILKTPIHLFGEEHDIQIFTPTTLKNVEIETVDIVVLVAYGLIIPKFLLEKPKFGCINLHPSLLPRWRGASPIESSIAAGDEKTGVSIIKMNENLDEGDVFMKEELYINNNNFQQLHDRLANLGANLLLHVLENIEKLTPKPQSHEGATYANKIKKSLIDWNNNADVIEREIRAFGGKNFYLNGKLTKILSANFLSINHSYSPGEIINNELHIACCNSILIPLIIQPDSKNPMLIKDFINGYGLK